MKTVEQIKKEINELVIQQDMDDMMGIVFEDLDELITLKTLLTKMENEEIISKSEKKLEVAEIIEKAEENMLNGIIGTNNGVKYFYDIIQKEPFKYVEKNGIKIYLKNSDIVDMVKKSYNLNNNKTREIAKLIARKQIDFNPQKESEYFDNEKIENVLNSFKKTELLSIRQTEQIEKIDFSNLPNIKILLDNLFNKDEEATNYWLNWFSYITQTMKKSKTAWIFQGPQGAGKGTLYENIIKPIFGRYAVEIGQSDLYSDFNEWAIDALFVNANEIQIQDGTRNSSYNRLKAYITDTTLRLNDKGIQKFENINNMNFHISGNGMTIQIESTDRRYNVVGTGEDLKYACDIYVLLEGIKKELKDFVQQLKNLKVNTHEANTPMKSEEKTITTKNSETNMNLIARAIKTRNIEDIMDLTIGGELNDKVFDNMIIKIKNDFENNFLRMECIYWLYESTTGEELSPAKITKLFSKVLKSKITRTRKITEGEMTRVMKI